MLKQPLKCSRGSRLSSPTAEDKQLAHLLAEHLRRSPWQAGFVRVDVTVCRQEVSLSGVVHSFHLKQIAQTLILRAIPGKPLKNDLTVVAE